MYNRYRSHCVADTPMASAQRAADMDGFDRGLSAVVAAHNTGSVRPLRAVGWVFGWRNRRDGRGDLAGFVPHSAPCSMPATLWPCVRGGEAWRRGATVR
jgi:hypothetical protein